jgi:hypothetical protein
MNTTIITSLKIAIIAIVFGAFTSTSFAAVDMFLEIKDLKGKVVSRCEVSKDGSFSCPALPAGEYTASVSWSWGVSNSGAHTSSSSGGRIASGTSDGSTNQWPMVNAISCTYNVKSPRDAASGQATGKRQHKPMKLVKELEYSKIDKSSPKLSLGSFIVDEDCDGITGKIACTGDGGKSIEIESFSWGVSNSGASGR